MADPTVSPAGLRVVRLLIGCEPQTVSDMIRATGVTRTAVTEQLNELVAAGYVDRSLRRLTTRGRPRHLYSANLAALRTLFPNNQHLVVPAIWRAIEEIGGAELSKKVLNRVTRAMVDHYSARITAREPKERLKQYCDLLTQEGGMIETCGCNGHVSVNRRSCPFISMVDENRTVCAIDLDMMSTIVGAPVERVACRHDGDPSCVFRVG